MTGLKRNVLALVAFLIPDQFVLSIKMILPLPDTDNDAAMYEALDIAMDYLEKTGRVGDHEAVQAMAASVILSSFGRGVRHSIRLANDAIVALETVPIPAEVRELQSFYLRLVPEDA
jgi:hypothetical protein